MTPADPTPVIRTEIHRAVDLPLGAGAVLRIALVPDPEYGDRLVLSRGFGDVGESSFRRPHWAGDPIVLPASILPELRAALDALAGEE